MGGQFYCESAVTVRALHSCVQVNSLQFENDALKKRVAELEKLKDRSDLEEYMKNNRVRCWSTSPFSSVACVLSCMLFFHDEVCIEKRTSRIIFHIYIFFNHTLLYVTFTRINK